MKTIRRSMVRRTRRRQRGKGVVGTICTAALLGLLATSAKAEGPKDAGLVDHVKAWWNSKDMRETATTSQALATAITANLFGPAPTTEEIDETATCEPPPDKDAQSRILSPFLDLPLGKSYTVTWTPGSTDRSVKDAIKHAGTGPVTLDLLFANAEDIHYVQISSKSGEIFQVPANSLTLTPTANGGRRRLRKTLHRKK
jgi:hypothetical protein